MAILIEAKDKGCENIYGVSNVISLCSPCLLYTILVWSLFTLSKLLAPSVPVLELSSGPRIPILVSVTLSLPWSGSELITKPNRVKKMNLIITFIFSLFFLSMAHYSSISDSLFTSNHWAFNVYWTMKIRFCPTCQMLCESTTCYADCHMSWEGRIIVYNVMILVKL